MITLRQLRYLTALARHRHFGRAAEDCAVTQPALSMQVRELETRTRRRRWSSGGRATSTLTDTGLESRAAPSRSSPRPAISSIFARHRDVLAGPLRLGIIPTLAPYMLPRAAAAICRRNIPALRSGSARDADQACLLEELRAANSMSLMLALPVEGADVETLTLFDDAFLLAVPAADARPAARPRRRRGLSTSAGLILLEEGHCLRDQALAFCACAAATTCRHGLGATLAGHRDADGGERLRRDAAAGGRGRRRGRATSA